MSDSRYERLELIDWWDGELVSGARALVVGAGALGTEVVKNLLLLGWGVVVIVDHDRIELSNLSRSVLYDASDVGAPKASTLARNAARVNPDPVVVGLDDNVRTAVSSGLVSRMDVVFGCVDNLAARVVIGQLAGGSASLYIDGGLSTWEGAVRVFGPPEGPCYACGLTADDLRQLRLRRSCLVYQREAAAQGSVATTPTVASVTSALMVQQALKWLHRDRHALPVSVGCELRVNLAYDQFWHNELPRNEECVLHPVRIGVSRGAELTRDRPWKDILAACRQRLGAPDAVIHLPVQVLERWTCPDCGATEAEVFRPFPGDPPLTCPKCDSNVIPHLANVLSGTEPWAALSPAEMGFPPWTWIEAQDEQTFELAGAPATLSAVDRS